MKQVSNWQFAVRRGERVTLRVVPSETQALCVVALDGQALFGDYSGYQWEVVKDVGEIHVLVFMCKFLKTAPNTARYDIRVNGSENGGEFLFSVGKSNENDQG